MRRLLHRYLHRYSLGFLILACAAGAAGAAGAQRGPTIELADDLAVLGKQAGEKGLPIMLVFTRPECPYCQRAKRDHLEPMHVSANYGAKVMMREVIAADAATLRDFDGKATTHGELARKYDVRSVPTVLLVDARGKSLTDPIIGLSSSDFYNLYLEQAIDAARTQLRQN